MNRVIRYFQSPAFTAAEWSARNPYLNVGEVGYLIEGGLVTRAKVGPGYWNALNFVGLDQYPYSDLITNPIGDVTAPVDGETLVDIIRKMISPYVSPVISSLVNDISGVYELEATLEIGRSFSGPINLLYNITYPGNLSGATPIHVDGGAYFVSGNYDINQPIPVSILSPPLSPGAPLTLQIALTATHINGVTSPVVTTIKFAPRIMWTSSPLSTISDGSIFVGKSKTISTDFKNDYAFPGGGYSWLAIPSMLSPSALMFTDVTNPDLPGPYSMESMGTLVAVNNGVGTYNYELYRSTFSLINSTKLRVRQ